MVKVEQISKRYGRLLALDGLSFEVRQGEILGFLGPNGAGKTTAIRILTGFFPPTGGKVWIAGKDLFADPRAGKKRIGYLPESVTFYEDMRVHEFLNFAAQVKGVPRKKRRSHVEEKMARCGVWDVKNRLIGQLSKGFKQRTGLAQALIGEPEVLFLDEPTNGLDPKQIIEIRSLVRELGRERTLILCTHILPEASMVCDRVLIINQGKMAASGTAEELEAGLHEQQEIFVTMGDRHRRDECRQLLQALPGVDRVSVLQERNDQVSFSLMAGKGQDLRPLISRAFAEHRIPLFEIRSGRLSLEEIFMKLVIKENGVRRSL
jgi:ABC-2 type transport system ATP-binding protein